MFDNTTPGQPNNGLGGLGIPGPGMPTPPVGPPIPQPPMQSFPDPNPPVGAPLAPPPDLTASPFLNVPAQPMPGPQTIAYPTVPAMPVAAPVPPSDLLDIKRQALGQLSPLVTKLDQTPEEKFRTTMMMIQAGDDQSLIGAAYSAAQAITDEKARAQALLDVINEINYFSQKQQGQQ